MDSILTRMGILIEGLEELNDSIALREELPIAELEIARGIKKDLEEVYDGLFEVVTNVNAIKAEMKRKMGFQQRTLEQQIQQINDDFRVD